MFTLPQFQFLKWGSLSYDPYFSYTSFLINAESVSTGSQNITFIDSSVNNITLAVAGYPTQTSVSPYAANLSSVPYSPSTHGGSIYLDGQATTEVYGTTAVSALGFSNSDFTVEAYIYQTVRNANGSVIFANFNTAAGANGLAMYLNSTGKLTLGENSGSTVLSGGTVSLNQWTHVAVVRNGSVFKGFIDGTEVASVTSSKTYASTGTAHIGGIRTIDVAGPYSFTGYVSDLRVIKGTALYTSAFTPPSTVLGAIANTSFLLKGTNAAIYDRTGKNAITTVGTTSATSTIVKFGNKSIAFNGAITDYLVIPQTTSNILSSGTPFTIEGWFYPTMSSYTRYISLVSKRGSATGSTASYGIYLRTSTGVISIYNGVSNLESSTTLNLSAWNHLAITYDGTNIRMYKNGTSFYGPSAISFSNKTGSLHIGNGWASGTEQFQGYMDDVRITKGINRYSGLSSFTIPVAAYPTQ